MRICDWSSYVCSSDLHRFYSPGGALTIDDEVFEKLTIWFKSSRPESGAITIDSSVVVVHTKGGSAWPQSACSGIIESGQIRITPKGRSRSEEHTPELQSLMRLSSAVLLCKKNRKRECNNT